MINNTLLIINIMLLVFLIIGIVLVVKYGIEQEKKKEEIKAKEESLTERIDSILKETEEQAQIEFQKTVKRIRDEENTLRKEAYDRIQAEKQEYRKSFNEDIKEMKKNFAELKLSEEKRSKQEIEKINKDYAAQISKINDAAKKIIDKLTNEQAAMNELITEGLQELKKEDLGLIKIPEIDKKEIAEIESVIKYFRNPIHIKKAIFESYYRNPVREMINLITKGNKISGIYKVTNLVTNQCYIGQSVNIGDRWLSHIKRGLGTEPLTNNLLYPAMIQYGVQNFKFEILEETEYLNEREKFYGQLYAANIIGYNLRVG